MAKPRLNRISIVLDELGLDQLDLAEILKVSKDTVSRWCRNANQPKLSELYKIAQKFRIDMRRLVESTEWNNEDGLSELEKYLETKQLKKAGSRKKTLPKGKVKK